MGITSAIVLYMVIWFTVLFVVLPLRLRTQAEAGTTVPGTPPGAPEALRMGRKLRHTTLISLALWLVLVTIILTGAIEVRDFDWLNQLPPLPADGTGG